MDKDENNTGKVIFRQIISNDENMTIYGKEQVLDGFTDLIIIDDEEENEDE